MVKAVIFDLDDTLIAENQYVESGYRHISQLLSTKYGENEEELHRLMMSLHSDDSKYVFNRTFDTLGISYRIETISELVEEYRNHLPTIEFYNDVLPCLKALKKDKKKIGLITDGYANAQRQKLSALKADVYFDNIIVTDEMGREYWKPHPRAFEVMRESLGVDFNEMTYIGDNPQKDFYIGAILPIETVRIHRNGVYANSNYLNNVKENYSIYSLSQLFAELKW